MNAAFMLRRAAPGDAPLVPKPKQDSRGTGIPSSDTVSNRLLLQLVMLAR